MRTERKCRERVEGEWILYGSTGISSQTHRFLFWWMKSRWSASRKQHDPICVQKESLWHPRWETLWWQRGGPERTVQRLFENRLQRGQWYISSDNKGGGEKWLGYLRCCNWRQDVLPNRMWKVRKGKIDCLWVSGLEVPATEMSNSAAGAGLELSWSEYQFWKW